MHDVYEELKLIERMVKYSIEQLIIEKKDIPKCRPNYIKETEYQFCYWFAWQMYYEDINNILNNI